MRGRSPCVACLVVLAVLICGGFVSADNVRLGFAQVAVGDTISTTLDLTNMGVDAFDGTLAILGDSGDFLAVSINGQPVNGPFDLMLAPGEVIRLAITAAGPTRVGHALVRDRQNYKSVGFGSQIDGTGIFELRNGGGEVIDSIGVPGSSTVFLGSGVRQHFFFVGETGTVSTGLALSNLLPGQINVSLTARAANRTVVDEAVINLPAFGHRAFFVHEVMTLPAGFRGTVEAEATGPLFALALRQSSETLQLSTIQVSALPLFFDFTVEIPGREDVSGEMTLNAADGLIRGLARITSHSPDGDFDVSPVTGSFIPGLGVIGSFYTSIESRLATVIFVGIFSESISRDQVFAATWAELDDSIPATFTLTRKEESLAAVTQDKEHYLAQAGGGILIDFDALPTGASAPLAANGVMLTRGSVRDETNSVQPHGFWFGDDASPPKFYDTSIEFEATFDADVTAVGFDLACFACDLRTDDSIFRWTLLSEGGTAVASGASVFNFRVSGQPPSKFFGVISSVPFRSISVIRVRGANWFLDDLRYVPASP